MNEDPNQQRIRAGQAAKDYLEGKITWDDFMSEFGESADEVVADLVEHEPGSGRLQWRSQVIKTVQALCQ